MLLSNERTRPHKISTCKLLSVFLDNVIYRIIIAFPYFKETGINNKLYLSKKASSLRRNNLFSHAERVIHKATLEPIHTRLFTMFCTCGQKP